MTLRQYLILMALATLVAWAAVLVILTGVDPERSTISIFVVLYAALLLASTGTFAIAGFLTRFHLARAGMLRSRQVVAAFRQALLLSILFVTALFLRGAGLLSWWNAIHLAAATSAAELFFATARAK
ncbi:hypothetical protein HY633_00290 [Candidatus Uhrbacteria bacterium]|nr:hypothetical protein [Candidatus Uhrbacteria bacterium]